MKSKDRHEKRPSCKKTKNKTKESNFQDTINLLESVCDFKVIVLVQKKKYSYTIGTKDQEISKKEHLSKTSCFKDRYKDFSQKTEMHDTRKIYNKLCNMEWYLFN